MENNEEVHLIVCLTEEGNVQIKENEKILEIKSDIKEIKASEILEFLEYDEDKKYILDEISKELQENEFVQCIYEIFAEIVDKINNIDNEEENQVDCSSYNDLPF